MKHYKSVEILSIFSVKPPTETQSRPRENFLATVLYQPCARDEHNKFHDRQKNECVFSPDFITVVTFFGVICVGYVFLRIFNLCIRKSTDEYESKANL